MHNQTLPRNEERKQKLSAKRFLKIFLQVIVIVVMFAILLWYISSSQAEDGRSLAEVLLDIKIGYLTLAFLMYFGINILFTVRLKRVLAKDNIKMSLGKTLLAQYAGMLTSDFTPGRSGYMLTPMYLRDQNVPTSKSLSTILGIQTIEFLIKVAGGIGAVIYLVKFVPSTTWSTIFPQTIAGINIGIIIAGFGIGLMLLGATVLALFTWSKKAINIFYKIANIRFIKRFTGGLIGKLEEYKDSAHSTKKAIPEILVLTLICWFLKGFEWWFLGLAFGINVPWIAFFLIHPLVTALAFIPFIPAGLGVQEIGITGILGLLGVPAITAGAFAIIARILLIAEDLIGLPQIVKSTSLLFTRKKSQDITTDATQQEYDEQTQMIR
ncbi:MAG: flippase-like domain-containing protein [Candidatus Bathyarchaeota archaeon]|nr:flippase-like domain-containing protein [Candidatus Termiticorpusculum sp.]MCL1971056.1 flippase-like domain-containing protein [Candidatus Termiticorpusculum sp.]